MTDVPFDKFTDGKTFKSKNDDDDDDNKDKYGISYLMDFTGMARLMVYILQRCRQIFFPKCTNCRSVTTKFSNPIATKQ